MKKSPAPQHIDREKTQVFDFAANLPGTRFLLFVYIYHYFALVPSRAIPDARHRMNVR